MTLVSCCEPCPQCHHSSCFHYSTGCDALLLSRRCPCKLDQFEAKEAFQAAPIDWVEEGES